MASLNIRAHISGKEGPHTTVSKTRVIMPMPSLLNVIDALLPVMLEPYFSKLLQVPRSSWIGARKQMQILDITHGLTTVIEKALDQDSAGALAQADIQQYYDTVVLLLVCRWLEERGVPDRLLAMVLRHQMLPTVVINVGSSRATITGRSIGSLTGSRVAGVMSKIPPIDVIQLRSCDWEAYGFPQAAASCKRRSMWTTCTQWGTALTM